MNQCACGNSINGDCTQCPRCMALRELGLKSGATDADVRAAYLLYVKACHPDRFVREGLSPGSFSGRRKIKKRRAGKVKSDKLCLQLPQLSVRERPKLQFKTGSRTHEYTRTRPEEPDDGGAASASAATFSKVKQQRPYFAKINSVKHSVLEVPSGASLGIPILFDSLDSMGSGRIQHDSVKSRPIASGFNAGLSRRSSTAERTHTGAYRQK